MVRIPDNKIHAKRYVKNGWRYQKKVTAMMVEDMLFDPILATKVLLGIKVPPHMELRILTMWCTYYTSDDSGVSTGKTMTHAIISALRSILMPDRVSGIISATFKQGQLIFAYYDRWYNSSKIFKHQIKHNKGQKRLVHGNSAWIAEFTNGSEIRALPPSISKDAESLRSERWNDLYLDEWTTFGNFGAITKTIFTRATRPGHFDECPVRRNHLHLSSTPHFTHHPSYSIIQTINKRIRTGDGTRARFTCNFTHIPRSKKWKWLIPLETIRTVIEGNPKGVVRSEVGGLWQEGSMSYHSSETIDNARSKSEIMEAPNDAHRHDQYIFAWDTNAGTSEGKDINRGDDFGLTVMGTDHDLTRAHHVSSFRGSSWSLDKINNIIYYIVNGYHPQGGCYDPSGGGTFVKNKLKTGEWEYDGNTIIDKNPIAECMSSDMSGRKILTPFGRQSPVIKMAWGKFASESSLPNLMHKNARSMMEKNEIVLAPEWRKWDMLIQNCTDVQEMREFMNSLTYDQMSESERIRAESDIAVRQLVMVDIKRDRNGNAETNKQGLYTFASKEKKDAAYGLLYCSFLFSTMKKLKKKGIEFSTLTSGSSLEEKKFSPVTSVIQPNRASFSSGDMSGFRVVRRDQQ